MARHKTVPTQDSAGREPTRVRILDAAERLLTDGQAAFSMRDLAAEASVSFATPFNQYGSKAAIMRALSARRIDLMEQQYSGRRISGQALHRVRAAVEIAATVMLEEPAVNRAIMEWLGTPHPGASEVLERSKTLWRRALGEGDGLNPTLRAQALERLPAHLAFGFRGVLSFWTAGEIPDEALTRQALATADSLLLGYAGKRRPATEASGGGWYL